MKTANTAMALLLIAGLWLPATGRCTDAGPAVQRSQGISYVSGGVGLGEREAMQQMAKRYNLRLRFAVKGTGTYLADIRVAIHDAKGRKVLDATSDGPWFFARLPAGRYKVTANDQGRALSKTAVVSGKRHTTLHFYWPQ